MNIKQNFVAIFDILKEPKSKWLSSADYLGSRDHALREFVIPMLLLSVIPTFLYSFLLGGFVFIGIIGIIISLLVQFLMLYVFAWLIGFLAPKFQGNPSSDRTFQYSALASSIGWLGAMLGIVPVLGTFVAFILYIYGIYVNYQGITPVLGVPESQRLVFFIALIVLAIIAALVISLVIGGIFGFLGLGAVGGTMLLAK